MNMLLGVMGAGCASFVGLCAYAVVEARSQPPAVHAPPKEKLADLSKATAPAASSHGAGH